MTSILTAIDPGVKRCGVAMFEDGRLIVARHLDTESAVNDLWGDRLIIEMPRVYGGRSSRGDTNDLLDLAMVVGRFQREAQSCGMDTRLVTPAQWKGQTPKDVMQRRTEAQLTEQELAVVREAKLPKSRAHNMWDAIALGLFALSVRERGIYVNEKQHALSI